MNNPQPGSQAVRVLPILAFLGILTSLAVVPAFFVSEAQSKRGGKGLATRTESHGNGIRNYDIRLDKNSLVKRGDFRLRDGIAAADVADFKDRFSAAEERLRGRSPHVKVQYSPETGIPEIIGPDVKKGKAALESARGGDRVSAVREFLRSNNDLFGVPEIQVDGLGTAADYTNPAGNMSWVILEQKIDDIPVFRGEAVAGFGKDGSLVRIVNGLAAGVEPGRISKSFGDPQSAVAAAASSIDHQLRPFETRRNEHASDQNRVVFGDGDFGTIADKMYFPLEPGTVLPAWRVLIRQDVASYYVIVDARSGDLLWRKNITEDQTESASYRVYTNPNAMVNIADSPFPITPGPTSPSFASQGGAISRTLVTRIGNESPYEFNSLGWLTNGATALDGNNVQAGLDRENPNDQNTFQGSANSIDPSGVPSSPSRTFDFPITPATPDGTGSQTGDSPLPAGQTAATCLVQGTNAAPTDFQKAVTTQLFYISNVFHDETYRLGFTEQHRNFQHDNFGRGGVGSDRLSAQSQDCSGSNNANFATPSDGSRPIMQMYIWTGATIDIDGSLDADVVIHELTHGLSNRLHSNAAGLQQDFARGMGEGWSDFYAHALLSEPSDPINGIYSTGAYDTYQHFNRTAPFANSYYGVRRFPKAVMAFTGGPNNRPHNPMTFQDIDATKISLSNGAFSPAFTSANADGVHAIGEVWSSALWEVRARMVQRLGWEVGNRRVLQFVTDGMKLSPANPNFISGRDAIVAAARASGTNEDVEDVWQGFAIRGIGFSASVQNNGGTSVGGGGLSSIRVTEAFDMPNLSQFPEMTVSDTQGGDGDGIFEPGEILRLTIPLTNTSGSAANDVMVQVVGSQTLSYGTIANNGTASNVFTYQVPAALACGSVLDVTINVTSSLGPISFPRKISTGVPVVTATENFDGMTPPNFAGGWTVSPELNGNLNPFVLSTSSSDSAPNAAFAPNPNVPSADPDVNGATSLTSPQYAIQSPSATVSFRHRYNTEEGWDGGVLEVSIDNGPFQDIVTSGGSFRQNGYNGHLDPNDNPLDNRNAWTGNSGGFITTIAQLPTAAAGKNVRFRWRFGTDDNTGVEGWFIDTVQISGQTQCSFVSGPAKRSDFDGDGRSDYALFRPSTGFWYVLTVDAVGFFGVPWGMNGDIPVPADYDNDKKTDPAIYRPGSGGTASYFYVLRSSDLTFTGIPWGTEGDVPVVHDYDGDELTDFAIYRPSGGAWYVYEADNGFQAVAFGVAGDQPIAGDFDGDGKGDFTVFRGGSWVTQKSSGGGIAVAWGAPTDMPVPADYTGDGRDDYAIFRPADGTWWVLNPVDFSFYGMAWGQNGDVPVPADYDGDGKYDPAIYRDGIWVPTFSLTGTHGGVAFGSPEDIPIAKKYIP